MNHFIGILQRQREQQQKDVDSEKLASARKRLQENYKEAENGSLIFFSASTVILLDLSIWAYDEAVCVCLFYFGEAKWQRTIQVMDIHEIPKPKNAFFGKNKGNSGGGYHGRH